MLILNADFRQNIVTKHTVRAFSWSLVLAMNKKIYMDTSLSSMAREVTAHLVDREKIAVTE